MIAKDSDGLHDSDKGATEKILLANMTGSCKSAESVG